MNVPGFAARLYAQGHQVGDFEELAHGLLVVSAVRPPEVLAGIHIPDDVRNVKVTYALAHRVERGGGGPLNVRPGDIVKVWNEHLDPVDTAGELAIIKSDHVKAVLFRSPRVGGDD